MRRFFPRRRLAIGAVVLAGVVALAAALGLVLYPRLGAWAIRAKALPKIEARLGRKLEVGAIDVRRGQAVLRNVVVAGAAAERPLAQIRSIVVDYDWAASLRGRVELQQVVLSGARVWLHRDAAGRDNISDVLARLRGDGSGSGGGGSASAVKLRIERGALEARDDVRGVTVAIENIHGTATRGGSAELQLAGIAAETELGPSARAEQLTVTAELDAPIDSAIITVRGGEASLWPKMSLSAIAGTIAAGNQPGALAIDLAGSYGGATEQLWQARGWLDPRRRTGHVTVAAERFTLDRIGHVLKGTSVVDVAETSVDSRLEVEVTPGEISFAGSFELRGGNVYHPMLAEKTVRGLSVAGALRGSFDRNARRLRLTEAELESGGVVASLTAELLLPGGIDSGARRTMPRLAAHLVVPAVACQTVLEALPPELVPYLQGYRLGGMFDTDVVVEIDWRDLQATVLDGSVGLLRCKVEKAPKDDPAARLRAPFTHYVEVEKDSWVELEIGPDNPDFVPLGLVSPYLLKSLMTTEDSAFYHHRGFISREFRSALIKNLEAGYFRYGASSITMQVVKNVILYREKTLARKLQELFFAWYIEQVLDKDRILEIYVNAIEYGPGIYGIGPAAWHYFGKYPSVLNPVEAAFFSSILPNPKQRYRQYCNGQLWDWSERKIRRILGLMHERDRLTDEEYEIYRDWPLVFVRETGLDARECNRMVSRALEKARPTNPMKK